MAEASSWTTTDGGGIGLEEFEGPVVEAWFATKAEYQSGEVPILNLKVQTPDAEDGFETIEIPVGKGWESLDGGKSVQRIDPKSKAQFHNSSWMGKLIDKCVRDETDGGLGLSGVLAKRGEATEAKVWEGLSFHFLREEHTFGKDKETKEPIKASRVLPTKFLGEVKDGAGAATAPAGGDQAAKIAAAKAAAAAKTNGGGLRGQLVELAKQHDTHAAFVDAALAVEGVAADDNLLAEVVEEGLLYAEARA